MTFQKKRVKSRRVGTTTTLLVARARTQTCSRVHLICRRRHASPSPALMPLLQPRACTLSAELAAATLKNPTKILGLCKPRYILWSASVGSVMLGVLNASLPFQSPELDFQPLELDKLARKLDNLPRPQPPDDNLNFPRTPSPTMHALRHPAHFPKEWGARQRAGCNDGRYNDGRCPPFPACYLMTHFLTMHMCFCLRECTLKQGCQHKKRYRCQCNEEWHWKRRWPHKTRLLNED